MRKSMSGNASSNYSGIGLITPTTWTRRWGPRYFCGLLTVALVVLKLTRVIAWPWVWVFAPLWILPALFCALVIVVLIFAAVVKRRRNKTKEQTETERASMTLPFEKDVPLQHPNDVDLSLGTPLPPAMKGAEEMAPELAAMKVGESILIPNLPGKKHPPVLAVSVMVYGFKAEKVFRTEYQEDGLRVWRRK